MNSDDFESKARLYVLGALDDEELHEFEQVRRELGGEAERIIQECERLNSMFALSLRPDRAETGDQATSARHDPLGDGRRQTDAVSGADAALGSLADFAVFVR